MSLVTISHFGNQDSVEVYVLHCGVAFVPVAFLNMEKDYLATSSLPLLIFRRELRMCISGCVSFRRCLPCSAVPYISLKLEVFSLISRQVQIQVKYFLQEYVLDYAYDLRLGNLIYNFKLLFKNTKYDLHFVWTFMSISGEGCKFDLFQLWLKTRGILSSWPGCGYTFLVYLKIINHVTQVKWLECEMLLVVEFIFVNDKLFWVIMVKHGSIKIYF